MKNLLNFGLADLITAERLIAFLQAVFILVLGWLVARTVSALVFRVTHRRSTPQGAMLVRRLVFYPLMLLILMAVLNQLGFKLGVLLGAAGILTVAIGFASQTSASNLISGLFLIVERPFVVGDVIQIEGTTGEVLSIDLLSIKLRTFDNLYVRVPNESIIKSRVTNNTFFPIRRYDLKVGVAYKEDLDRVRRILLEVAEANPLVLIDPKPLFIFLGFGDSSLDMQFSVWATRANFLEMRNQMHLQVKAAFDQHGVEIPFPHRTLYAGSETPPLPVRLVREGEGDGSASDAPPDVRPPAGA
jgi:small-conductance mechanosensitive channel